jgi:hypothetical protein
MIFRGLTEEDRMLDLILLIVAFAFFALSIAYVYACEMS